MLASSFHKPPGYPTPPPDTLLLPWIPLLPDNLPSSVPGYPTPGNPTPSGYSTPTQSPDTLTARTDMGPEVPYPRKGPGKGTHGNITFLQLRWRSVKMHLTSHFRVTNNDKFDWTKIRLWHNGSNVAYITSELVTSCNLDLKYYPFDKQTCDVKVRNEVTSSKGKTKMSYALRTARLLPVSPSMHCSRM